MLKYKCPKCGSKHTAYAIHDLSHDRSGSTRARIESGVCMLVEDPTVSYGCHDCGFLWNSDMMLEQPEVYGTKFRLTISDGKKEDEEKRAIEIQPDGTIQYTGYPEGSKKASVTVKSRIAPEAAQKLFAGLTEEYFESYEYIYQDCVGYPDYGQCVMKVTYVDGESVRRDYCALDWSPWLDIQDILAAVPEITEVMKQTVNNEKAQKDKAAKEKAEREAALKEPEPEVVDDGNLHCKSRKTDAAGRFTADGHFIVFEGSKVATTETHSCLKSVHEERERYLADGTIQDGILTRDVMFKGIARACAVVTGGLGDGGGLWKRLDGITYGQIDTGLDYSVQLDQLTPKMTEQQFNVYDYFTDHYLKELPRDYFDDHNLEQANSDLSEKYGVVLDEMIYRALVLEMGILREDEAFERLLNKYPELRSKGNTRGKEKTDS